MALRLRGATSGYIELKAPASAGDNTLTLPTNNGSANQLLKTDGSGNLSWTDDNSGVSLSGSTNNTIATVTGANALQGESVLTFDGNDFQVRPAKANFIVAKSGLTVKANSDLHTSYDLIQLGAGGALASYSSETATADTQFIHNAYRSSGGAWQYRYADTAMRLRMNSPGGAFIFDSAASGSADATVSFSEKARLDSDGRLRIGNTTQNQYTAADDLIVGSGSGNRGLTLYSGSSDAGVIAFSDGTSDTAYRSGQIIYDHNDDAMDFRTNGNYIRLTLTSNGKVSINTTAETVGGAPSGQLGQLNVLSTTASGQWAIQARADNTQGNGLFVRAGNNNSSYYTAYFTGYDEANVHMVIRGDGKIGMGIANPSHKLHIVDGSGTALRLGNTTNASTAGLAYNWGGSFGLKCDPDNNAGGTKHIYMQVTGTTYFNLSSSGKVTCTGVNSLTTTGGSAVYVESDGDLLRYTSSRKYKTDIETAEDKYADEILTCRPVWYRSTSTNDIKNSSKTKSDFGWFGFIAEEIAEINPRLVNYKTKESQQQSDGTLKSVELDPSAYEAESVRYTDFIPLMINLLKRQAAKIETLETKVAALESA